LYNTGSSEQAGAEERQVEETESPAQELADDGREIIPDFVMESLENPGSIEVTDSLLILHIFKTKTSLS